MLARKNRFQGRRDPRIVLKHGKTVRNSSAQLKFILRNDDLEYRAAVVVSTKVSKSAPVRNRIRRRVYEAIRELNTTLPADMVVLVYDIQLATTDQAKLMGSVRDLFQKAQL